MKKLNQLAIWVLAAAVAGVAQQPTTPTTAPQPAPGGQPGQTNTTTTDQQPAQPQQKKEIKDPAEYNAYMAAMEIKDPSQAAAKANALEQFIAQYPNSVVKDDALEQLMGAYQQAGNAAKAQDAAVRVLKVNPNNVRALLVLAYSKRLSAQSGNAADAPLSLQYGQQGLQALPGYAKPEGVPDADFQKFKAVAAQVFNGAVGIGALNAKDYPTAQKFLQTAYEMEVSANPNDGDAWLNAYPLATAYCSAKPVNPVGLWYGARAVALTKNNAANAPISQYVQHCYKYYHGDIDGWDQLMAQAATQSNPPANIQDLIKPAPTPAEQVEKIAAKPPKEMSFDDWKLIFTYGKPETVDRVWNSIKGVPLAFQALVIQAEKDRLIMAATYDGIQENKADTEVVMAGPIPPAKMPKVGTQIAVVATPVSFDKDPYMMHLDGGKLAVAKGAAHPPARRTTRRSHK